MNCLSTGLSGPGRAFFRIQAEGRVCALHFRCGDGIRSVQISYLDGNGREDSTHKFGGTGGELKVFRLKPGESISGIREFGKDDLRGLIFLTDQGREARFGDIAGQPDRSFTLSPGQEFIGFCGWCSDRILSLGMILKNPEQPEQDPQEGFDYLPGLA